MQIQRKEQSLLVYNFKFSEENYLEIDVKTYPLFRVLMLNFDQPMNSTVLIHS